MNGFRTTDYDASAESRVDVRMRFYCVEKLSDHQSMTPEGFLAVVDVPLCRTGVLLYGPGETPITTGKDGHVKIFRDPEQVFSAEHLASILGKPVVNDHPNEDVVPANFKRYHVGHAVNVRRGDGVYEDCIVADLLITDPQAIKAVQSGKREVSMGYDCDYEEVEPGIGRQHNIIANHIALVEAGRCGPRCSIKDHQTKVGANMKLPSLLGRILRRAKIGDRAVRDLEEELEKAKKEGADDEAVEAIKGALKEAKDDAGELLMTGEEGGTHIHIHTGDPDTDPASTPEAGDTRTYDDEQVGQFMEQNEAEHSEFRSRLDALEAALAGMNGGAAAASADNEAEVALEEELEQEAPAAVKDKARKARDSQFLGNSFQETVAGAEILAPGIRFPAFDAKMAAKDSLNVICNLRRKAIDLAYHTPEGRGIVEEIVGDKPLDLPAMSCGEVRSLFRGAVAAKRIMNNVSGGKANDTNKSIATGTVKSLGDLNKTLNAHWAAKSN